MGRPPLLERSLAVVDPELAVQLHPSRNGDVDAGSLAAGSGRRVWWRCDAGHDWQAVVGSRTRGSGCPYCRGRLPTELTCLAARNPALAGEWHQERNLPLTARDVLPFTRRKVWWCCPRCAHEWVATVQARTAGAGCPSCGRDRPRVGLLEGYPQLREQWDGERNGVLTASVASRSGVRVWWCCGHGHRWQASVSHRTRGQGCPYCTGTRATPQTSIAAVRPELMAEWAHDLNADLDPTTILPRSSTPIWWRCTSDDRHVWQVSLRNRGSRATGCPYCAGRLVSPQTALAAMHPALAAEWDTERNAGCAPTAVTSRSKAVVGWRCAAGHRWRARVDDRSAHQTGCPYCQGKLATAGSSLAATAPALAVEWDQEKNTDLSPWSVRPFSGRHVWWRCALGHSWRAQISQRSRAHTGCPLCSSTRRHGRSLESARPDLAAQWSNVLNVGDPATVMAGSQAKAWWTCPEDPAHLWRAAVANRVRAGTGCPYCAHKRPTPSTCLAAAAPHLTTQWHPDHNATLSPTDLLPQSHTPVWWRCGAHHEWRASPADRLSGRSCPDCAARRRPLRPPAQTSLPD